MTAAGWHDARVDVIRLQESLSTPAVVWPRAAVLAMAKPTSTTRRRSRERVACEGGRDRQRIPSASLKPLARCLTTTNMISHLASMPTRHSGARPEGHRPFSTFLCASGPQLLHFLLPQQVASHLTKTADSLSCCYTSPASSLVCPH